MFRIGARAAGAAILGAAVVAGFTMTRVEAQDLEGPTWRAEQINGSAAAGAATTISIAPGGKVSGSGGCNRLTGSATIAGPSITFGPIASTRMACAPAVMTQERNFLDALATARAFHIEGGRLTLLDAAGTEAVRFQQER